MFRILTRDVEGRLTVEQVADDLSALADAVLRITLDRPSRKNSLDPLAVPTTIVPWDQADEAWLEPATKLVLEWD